MILQHAGDRPADREQRLRRPRSEARRRWAAAGGLLAAVLALGACASIETPATDLASGQFDPDLTFTRGLAEPNVPDEWITRFEDPALPELAREAMAYNPDLMVAAGRWEEALARVREATSLLRPVLDGVGVAQRTDEGQGPTSRYRVELAADWEVDLWGRLRSGVAASESEAAATGLEFAFARQSLAAAVAQSWFTAIAARNQLAIDLDRLAVEQATARIAQAKLDAGAGTQLDAEIALANVALAAEAAANSRAAIEETKRALELLLGRYPAAELEVAEQLPAVPGAVPVGLPAELLERRLDVVAADRRVAAAFHRVESAKAAKLPRVALSASLGSLLDPTETIWSLGANLLAPLYTGGELEAQVEITEAQQRQALANYVGVGLDAFREVESALASEVYLQDRQQQLADAETRLNSASTIAQARYDAGILSIFDLTQVRRQYFDTRSQHLGVRAERLRQRVNLFLALGGDFEPIPAQNPDQDIEQQPTADTSATR